MVLVEAIVAKIGLLDLAPLRDLLVLRLPAEPLNFFGVADALTKAPLLLGTVLFIIFSVWFWLYFAKF
jgi:hypothetical protein